MPLPKNTADVLIAAGYQVLRDFVCVEQSGETRLEWSHTDPQPTEQQINDWANSTTQLPSGQTFAQWLAINGGDVLLTLHSQAKQFFAAQKYESAVIRAFMLLVLDELNAHSTKLNSVLTAIDNAASLAQLKTAVAAITDLPVRTAQQLRTAIQNKIDAGDADT